MYRIFEMICCTPESNLALYINYTKKKKTKKQKMEIIQVLTHIFTTQNKHSLKFCPIDTLLATPLLAWPTIHAHLHASASYRNDTFPFSVCI